MAGSISTADTGDRKKAIVLLSAATAVFAANLVALSPVVANLAGAGGKSRTSSGLLFTVHFLGFIVFSLASGAVSDRIGKKKVLVVAMGTFTVGFILFAFLNVFWAECLVMFLLGGCGGIVECLGSALASDLDPEHPEAAVNLLQLFFALAALFSPLAVSFFLEHFVFWKSFYLILAAFSAILFLLMSRTSMESPHAAAQSLKWRDLIQALKDPGFLAMGFCMLAYTGAEVGAWGWLSTLLQQKISFGATMAGLGVALFWVAMTAGRYICGILIKHIRVDRLIIALAVFSALTTGWAVFIRDERLLLVVVVCIGLGCSSQFPLLAGFGSRMTKLPSGAAFTFLIVSGNVGAALVPLAMGVIGDSTGLDKALLLPVILFASVALIMTLNSRKAI